MRPAAILVLALMPACPSVQAIAEEQLPINELYPCEVVLDELIADMRGLRTVAKKTLTSAQTIGENEKATAYDAVVQAWDEAIKLATKKIGRCP
jgi:hypothetical protein